MAKTRARTKKGAFIADDPNTPENEAWVRTCLLYTSDAADE